MPFCGYVAVAGSGRPCISPGHPDVAWLQLLRDDVSQHLCLFLLLVFFHLLVWCYAMTIMILMVLLECSVHIIFGTHPGRRGLENSSAYWRGQNLESRLRFLRTSPEFDYFLFHFVSSWCGIRWFVIGLCFSKHPCMWWLVSDRAFFGAQTVCLRSHFAFQDHDESRQERRVSLRTM